MEKELRLREALATARGSDSPPAVLACVRTLVDQIMSGRIKPMEKLEEDALSQQLGISRLRVRRALDHLANSGIVDRHTQSGTYVRCLSIADLVECSAYRGLLEGFAVRDASRQMTRSELRELENEAIELDMHVAAHNVSWPYLRDLDVAFHARLSRYCTSGKITDLLQSQHFIARYLSEHRQLNVPTVFQIPEGRRQSVPTHHNTVQALSACDPDGAEKSMRLHVLWSVYVVVGEYAALHQNDSHLNAEAEVQLTRLRGWLGESSTKRD